MSGFRSRSTGGLRSTLIRLLASIALCGAYPALAVTWVTVKSVDGLGTTPIEVEGQTFPYHLLHQERPTLLEVRGPRRVKIVTRYLYGESDPAGQKYVLTVMVDGGEVLRKRFTARPHADVRAPVQAEVSALRKCTVEIGTGKHTLQVRAETTGAGRVLARFFQESRFQKVTHAVLTPDVYDAVYRLQFASGSQSTYYHFSAKQPLVFFVNGPTNLQIYNRLDFTHAMNGSQPYSLEVLCDGEPVKSFHYQTKKLSSAMYLERPDILPGSRKQMRLSVPAGPHRFEIRCLRPPACGVAAKIRIPEADLDIEAN